LCHWNFSLTNSFRSRYVPGVDSDSNRNEYQRYYLGSKGGRCIRLTTLLPSRANCLKIWESQTSGTVRACPGIALSLPLPYTLGHSWRCGLKIGVSRECVTGKSSHQSELQNRGGGQRSFKDHYPINSA